VWCLAVDAVQSSDEHVVGKRHDACAFDEGVVGFLFTLVREHGVKRKEEGRTVAFCACTGVSMSLKGPVARRSGRGAAILALLLEYLGEITTGMEDFLEVLLRRRSTRMIGSHFD